MRRVRGGAPARLPQLPENQVKLVVDTETNGLLDRPDLRLLTTVTMDVETGEVQRFPGWGHPGAPHYSKLLREHLANATMLIGHNLSGFDIHVFERHFGQDWTWDFDLFDTRSISRLRYISTIEQMTWAFRRSAGPSEVAQEAKYPKALTAPNALHKLASWGYRLALKKGDYLDEMGVQEAWSQPLEDYCEQDVHVTAKLYQRMLEPDRSGRPAPPLATSVIESMYCYLLQLQEMNGITFDMEKAAKLHAALCGRRDELAARLKAEFQPWYRPALVKGDMPPADLMPFTPGCAPLKVPKITYKVAYPSPLAGREKGCAYTPVEVVEFNPASRDMIADRLIKLYGWKPDPEKTTKTGAVQVDETVLSDLDYPPIPLLIEYLVTEKTLGQLAEGDKSWMKAVKEDGRIHHSVQSTGARTTRCSHSRPNLAQVPKVKKYPKGHPTMPDELMRMFDGHFGAECRDLFGPSRRGWVIVGCDASGLELRMLAHRLAFYDGGAFARLLLEGDPHTEWQRASGLWFRDNQKTLTYAFLYGAGNKKLGMIVLDDWHMAFAAGLTDKRPPARSAAPKLGRAVRDKLLGNVPGLQRLIMACLVGYERGYVKLIDGTTVVCKTEHGTLNDVLQGDGARVMKWAKVLLHSKLKAAGMRHGWHYGWLLDVHDEWQLECPEHMGVTIGKLAADCIAEAGKSLGIRLPLAAEYKVGKTWMETH